MEGWDFFDPPPPAVDDIKQDIDILITRTFSTEEGRQVLAWLRQVTIEVPAWVPGQEASYGYAREGQNSLVREIERRMERGKL
jgi:hypothetical protein